MKSKSRQKFLKLSRGILRFPAVMGILNVTPDSFSDGGKYFPNPASQKVHEQFMNNSLTLPLSHPIVPSSHTSTHIPAVHEQFMNSRGGGGGGVGEVGEGGARDEMCELGAGGERSEWRESAKGIKRGLEMIEDGVDIIDIGGESTGPGSTFVTLEEELRRVIPVIKKIAPITHRRGIFISVDTYKPEVARQAIAAGADMINDVTALRGDKKMASVAAKLRVPIILMYSKDLTPHTTHKKIRYKNVIQTVKQFLKNRIQYAVRRGVKKSNIVIDPGMGAFVSALPEYSFEILSRLSELKKLEFPVLIGPSKKSFLGGDVNDRSIQSLIASFSALQNGADIIRVHDTQEAVIIKRIIFS